MTSPHALDRALSALDRREPEHRKDDAQALNGWAQAVIEATQPYVM
jgi:hypothetical protein